MRSFRVFRGKAPDDRMGRDPSRAERQPPEKSKTFWAGGEICRENRPHIDTTLSYHKISVNSTHKLRKSLQIPITGVAARPGRGSGKGLSAVNCPLSTVLTAGYKS